ncbi:MAG: glycosyltransferase [Xanthobacteraceae bacterium]
MLTVVLASISLAIWLYLLAGRSGFWRCAERDEALAHDPSVWPRVTAVVPARNEAECIALSITSLLRQDYPGPWSVLLVDDDSSDATADIARRAAAALGIGELRVVAGRPLPSGWTGKLWAVAQGVDAAMEAHGANASHYLLLTDADIVHASDSLRALVAHAEQDGLVLNSRMVKLRCESATERAHVPAFIFFFQMLYPFAAVNRPDSSVAAAAGGCMLVRADALRKSGGIAAVRSALIDDCALAGLLKEQGPIWLALTERAYSIRAYPALSDIRHMVARSAYAQLRYSPLLLIGTVAGMALTYLVPPAMALFGGGAARVIGVVTWLLMAAAFQPVLRLYRVSPLWGFALPAIAFQYLLFTIDSAYQHARGRGGSWKGRVQAKLSERA